MKWESDPRTQNALHRLRDYGDLRSKSGGSCSRIARARDGAAHTGSLRRRYSASVAIPLSYSFIAVGAFRFHVCGSLKVPSGGTVDLVQDAVLIIARRGSHPALGRLRTGCSLNERMQKINHTLLLASFTKRTFYPGAPNWVCRNSVYAYQA